jgi:hypothetical protein
MLELHWKLTEPKGCVVTAQPKHRVIGWPIGVALQPPTCVTEEEYRYRLTPSATKKQGSRFRQRMGKTNTAMFI